jgi:hypothetical protein
VNGCQYNEQRQQTGRAFAWLMHVHYHALRSRCLDHEHHDMNEPRETATADLHQAISGLVGAIA